MQVVSRIAFTKSVRDEESYETPSHIHLHDIDSGVTRQPTYSEKGESSPRWLPDGRILFTSNRDDRNRLWVIDPDGGEAIRFTEDDDTPNGTLSPDFSRIAFTEESDRADQEGWDERVKKGDDGYYWEHKLTWRHIWVYDIETGTRRQLTTGEFDHSGPTWSPDGECIAFTSNRTGTRMGDPDSYFPECPVPREIANSLSGPAVPPNLLRSRTRCPCDAYSLSNFSV